MMGVIFKPAIRERVPILIGLSGGTGSGKTFSALRIAKGIAGEKPFAVIDTENRRALHYAGQFKFDHAEIRAPFRPETYIDALMAAHDAKYEVAVIDSTSHIWAGDGGCLDWHESELDRMAGDDWKKRDKCAMAAWVKPKVAHKKFVQQLLQIKMHIILCFRAEPKVEMVKENGKTIIKEKESLTGLNGWIPVCEKNLPFELMASFLLTADRPGYPYPIKLQEQHKNIFKCDLLGEQCGKDLLAWANGGENPPAKKPEPKNSELPLKQITDGLLAISDNDKIAAKKKLELMGYNSSSEIDTLEKAQKVIDQIAAEMPNKNINSAEWRKTGKIVYLQTETDELPFN